VHGTIDSLYRVEWRPLAELAAIAADWRALAARAAEPNVFYEPAFALAAAPAFGAGVGAGLIWTRATAPRLVGLFPARIERRRHGVPLPVLIGWTHPYAPLGVPLVDRDLAEAAIEAWLEHVAHDPQLPDTLLLPYFPVEGALGRALDSVITRRGGGCADFARHARALLAPSGTRATYLDDAVGAKKRKELRRQRKRLAEGGDLTTAGTSDPFAIAAAVADFLALEAGGWKGRAGTAARNHVEIAGFMSAAVSALAAEGKAGITQLALDRRAIAAMITLRSGATAWTWKIAYDERYARFSPGVQILLDVTQALLDDPSIMRADSCATADHPMIDHVWRERLVLADRLLSVERGPSLGFSLACRFENTRRVAINAAKRLRDLLRRMG
jgi:CelD/BcsL family acetyltransferase involved in cellulose biosynthesis